MSIYNFFRITCESAEEQEVVKTVSTNTLMTTFSNLHYHTQYNCCVEAIYTTGENAVACLTRLTQENGITFINSPKINAMFFFVQFHLLHMT